LAVKDSFGLGGGSSKSRLVANLTEEYRKLNNVLKETEKLSKSIATNLKNSSGGKGGSNAGGASSMTSPTPPPGPAGPAGPAAPGAPGGPGGPGTGGSTSNYSMSSAIRSMAGTALTALATGVDAGQYVENDIARRRFGFFSGVYSRQNDNIGTIAGMKAFASMSSRGTPVSAMDAANATMAGSSMGIMPGLKNYNTIINSTAGISNILPGSGLEGAMGAVSALNQGASVNKLRMIGINVRDQNGFMRGVEDIARDLWKSLNTNKSGRSNITEADLSFSLQPGNSLDMMLDQYFGTDAVLRQAIVSYLFQFAKNNGAKIGAGYQSEAGKKELLTTGASPGIVENIGRRNKAGAANVSAYTSAGVAGIQGANDTITKITEITTGMSSLLEALVGASTFSTTLGSAGNGTGGILIKGAVDTAKSVSDVGLSALKLSSEVLIAAAVLAGIVTDSRHATQMEDEQWADAIANGQLTPNDKWSYGGISTEKQIELNQIKADHNAATGTSAVTPTASTPTKPIKPKLNASNNPTWDPARQLVNIGVHPTGFVQQSGSMTAWAGSLLKEIGAPVTAGNIASILAWMNAESSSENNYQTWNNPLNTTRAYGNSINKNYAHVQEFATESAGLTATALTLKQDNFKGLLDLFKNDAGFNKITSAITNSKWGTNTIPQYVNITVDGSNDPTTVARTIKEYLQSAAEAESARDGTPSGGMWNT